MVKTALLLRRARQGDIDAFAALFEPLRARIYAVACRLVGSTDAEDVVMDTFVRAWQALPAFKGSSALGPWLCRIARNKAIDHLRRSRVRRAHVTELEDIGNLRADDTDMDSRTPADELLRRELQSDLRRAVEKLPEIYRQVLLLRYADELSYAEIAVAAGISMGTVMSRLFNAKRKLRAVWTDLTDAPKGGRHENLETTPEQERPA
jgi:RNA polymerase sigma-70 factor (ECF subfamily)